MNNDELLQRQAALIAVIGESGERLQSAIGRGAADVASASLKEVFASVDELRAGVRPQPYYPAMGEEVWVRGRVVETGDENSGGIVRVEFSDEKYDWHWIGPGQTEVKPL